MVRLDANKISYEILKLYLREVCFLYRSKIKINEVWYSKDEIIWNKALDEYWNRVKEDNKSQLDVEYKIDKIKADDIKALSLDGFYSFITKDYFRWKFNPRDCKSFQKKFYTYYVEGKRLCLLEEIKNKLFSFDVTNIRQGLEIVTEIHCMRVIAGSGLLAVLFPDYYGTIDQFVIKSLLQIDGLQEHKRILNINQSAPTINDGIFLIELMTQKATELNKLFRKNSWRPRDIDKVLWALREDEKALPFNEINSAKNDEKPDKLPTRMNRDIIADLKYHFYLYLKSKGRKEDRIREDCSWAFTHYNHYIGIDFWDSFKSEENIKKCYQCFYEVALNGGFTGKGVKDPKGYAASYISSVKRLKDFFDEKYNGVENYLKLMQEL